MAKKATRKSQYSEPQLVLFVALELGATKWELGFSTGFGQKPRRRTIDAGETEQLQSEIGAAKKRLGLAQDAPVKSCYEAGRDGFWVDRYLKSIGVENIIADSSSIEVNRRRRRAKTDSLDVGKLLVMLMRYHSGERKVWSVVRVPWPEEEDRRQLHRELRSLKKVGTRTTNRPVENMDQAAVLTLTLSSLAVSAAKRRSCSA